MKARPQLEECLQHEDYHCTSLLASQCNRDMSKTRPPKPDSSYRTSTNKMKSPLLRIPAKLRRKIFSRAWGNAPLHLRVIHRSESGYDTMVMVPTRVYGPLKMVQNPQLLISGLPKWLLTCTQVRNEGMRQLQVQFQAFLSHVHRWMSSPISYRLNYLSITHISILTLQDIQLHSSTDLQKLAYSKRPEIDAKFRFVEQDNSVCYNVEIHGSDRDLFHMLFPRATLLREVRMICYGSWPTFHGSSSSVATLAVKFARSRSTGANCIGILMGAKGWQVDMLERLNEDEDHPKDPDLWFDWILRWRRTS